MTKHLAKSTRRKTAAVKLLKTSGKRSLLGVARIRKAVMSVLKRRTVSSSQ